MIPLLAETGAGVSDVAVFFKRLLEALPGAGLVPPIVFWPLAMLVVAAVMVAFISVFALFAVWLERKISARIQCRLGPMEVGPVGLFEAIPIIGVALGALANKFPMLLGGIAQTAADGVKLLAKEDVIPAAADRPLYIIGPIIVFLGVFAIYPVLPFGPGLIGTDLDVGLFFVAAVGSLEAIGVMMAGWASNNKWSLFATMRTATQVVSYEIPLSLAFVAVIACAGTFSLMELSDMQRGWITKWYLFANPFTFISFFIYYIASLAQVKRAPFDLPEAESELVSGFHTEYSGMRFSIFFLSEYAAMYVVSAVAAVVYLGGYYTGIGPVDDWMYANRAGLLPNLIGFGAILTKSLILVSLQMILRWTLPRIRLDQVMHLCLKVLLPFAIVCVVGAAAWQQVLGDHALLFFKVSR